MLFFSRNRVLSVFILLVSFFIPESGIAALLAVVTSLITAQLLGFDKTQVELGLYSYSALLFGLGFATNFEWGTAFLLLLIIGAVLSTLLSVALSSRLNVKNIPGLSLAFIFTSWIMLLAAWQFNAMGLTQRHIYWVNETYALGGTYLVNWVQKMENIQLPIFVSGYFRSMSAIIFQGNITAGILLTIGLLYHSRISFTLSVFGYTIAMLFNYLMGGFSNGNISYYNLGTNFMLVAVALGGFYIIPSIRSFFWTLISVPIAYVLVVGLSTITLSYGLPVFSLPFCITVILFLYCLQLRKNPDKLVTTPIQYYHPETNLYRFLNGRERLYSRYYFPFALPVMGEWMVSQGYDGSFTHKGEWGKAIDFVILDHEMKTFQLPAAQPTHFYCFNKPVLASGDGIIEEVIDHVEDNNIGQNNTSQNWGNTIIIKHATGLYSKVSHLKKNSATVQKGDFVKKGDLIAYCGNSGRSPEPHVHFQIQSTPYIGSKTISYPIGYFYARRNEQIELKNHTIPKEGQFVSNVQTDKQISEAFYFQPGHSFSVQSSDGRSETWEVMTDKYNESYFYCKDNESFAYFVNNGTVHYFSNFIGNKNGLLYLFYLSAYKVLLSAEHPIEVTDQLPLNVFANNFIRWIQDFTAPFFLFIRIKYQSKIISEDNLLGSGTVSIETSIQQQYGWMKQNKYNANITIADQKLQTIEITPLNESKITITCTSEN